MFKFGSEIKRICGKECNSKEDIVDMILEFANMLITSNKYSTYRYLILSHPDFIVDEIWFEICKLKKNKYSAILIENVKRCLEIIRLVNLIINMLYDYKNTVFNIGNQEHQLLLLKFRDQMKASITQTTVPITSLDSKEEFPLEINTNDWVDLGFQSSDPSTDFRGMGILSLLQLNYFSEIRFQSSKLIYQTFTNTLPPELTASTVSGKKQPLVDTTSNGLVSFPMLPPSPKSNGVKKLNGVFYPFAIIGINITGFLFEMITEQRLYRYLIEHLSHLIAGDLKYFQVLPSHDPICLEFGINIVHDFYCMIFEEFYLQFVIMNPDTIMYFTRIFDEVKSTIRNKYPPLSGNNDKPSSLF